ncbi:hypothetical protein HH212_21765 [Massilia forsythiae]|uniref:Uncharacterized protein n=1 Tax=Massilia forsythiae TaxID=2728020 RepID=A0A7Z2W055_9BURK|nr:hypothetical protein [Massilia forsythiae]QJE02325.1 hypothetical protein HH212_21765 [Massilia forsythiae]
MMDRISIVAARSVWQALAAGVYILHLAIAAWLGRKGTTLAWERGGWKTVEAFKRVQRRWTIASVAILAISLGLRSAQAAFTD